MGCAASSAKPSTINKAATATPEAVAAVSTSQPIDDAAARVASRTNSKNHRTPSRNASKSTLDGSKHRQPPSRTPSGKEGRHGFVPLKENSIGAKGSHRGTATGEDGITDDPLEGGDRFFNKHTSGKERSSQSMGAGAASAVEGVLNAAAHLVTRLSFETRRDERKPGEEEDGQPDFVLPVLFVLKKALEARDAPHLHITHNNLEQTITGIVSQLDKEQAGSVRRAALIDFVQTTCASANMAVPSTEQVQVAFSELQLAIHETVDAEALKAALIRMDWGLLPAA